MIKRRASEIIRLALTISQIHNADSLTWRDKIDLLNQSYERLYDDLNNFGDLYYVKEIELPSGLESGQSGAERKFTLPKDFCKLLLVGYRSSFGEIVPLERAPNVGQYFSGYRIINNELILNNFFTPGPLVVRYMPQPQTITFPRQEIRLPLPRNIKGVAYDSVNDVIVYNDEFSFTILDNSSGRTLTQDMEGVPFALAISNEVIYVVTNNQIQCFGYNPGDDGLPERLGGSGFGDFDIFIHSIGWEDGVIVANPPIFAGMPRQYRHFSLSNNFLQPSLNYWNFLDGKIIVNEFQRPGFPPPPVERTAIYSVEGEADQDITEIFADADTFVIASPYIYINRNGSTTVYEEFTPIDLAPAQIGSGKRKGVVFAAEANYETGYGVVFNDAFSGFNLLGFATDTVMNYPQNVFFDWLTTDLAVKFRIALDIPTGELPALADDYYDILFKSISRDAYQKPRINNVYGRSFL